MQSRVKVNITLTLELSEEEAEWLNKVTQNPITVYETPGDRDIRAAFFNATKPRDDKPTLTYPAGVR